MTRISEQVTPLPPASDARLEPRDTHPAPSGTRRTSEAPLAEPWRDVLLRVSTALPIDVSSEELARVFLEGVAILFPGAALGVCIVEPGKDRPSVVCRMPSGEVRGPERDPARLFPSYGEERIYDLDGPAPGSTFHIAKNDARDLSSPLRRELAEQAASVLGAALHRVATFARAEQSARDFHRLQAQVIQSEKLASLGQIVAGVVHELNNPLTSIIAYADYLKKKAEKRPGDDAEGDIERLRRIGEAADRILKFSRDLVAYARPADDAPAAVPLDDVIEKALSFCEHEFEESDVTVERLIEPDLPPALGIAGQLTQVFVNLFTNAAHAMNGGGRLRVVARSTFEPPALVVEVHDTGAGIAAEAMPQIFEPFFTTKTDGRGTGLGLSIVRSILEAHAGTVQVQSTPGRGTSFLLTLPKMASAPQASTRNTSTSTPRR